MIRGLSPYPAARTKADGLILKLYKAIKRHSSNSKAGSIKIIDDEKLMIAASDNWIEIQSLQLEGRKRMDAAQFLRGYAIGEISA